jgi:hypothetical protein
VAEDGSADGSIAVPIPLADKALVHARKLLPAMVEARFAQLPVGEIDGPAVKCGRALVRTCAVAVEHLRVPHDVNHTVVAFVVGVHGVEDIARFRRPAFEQLSGRVR